MLPTLKFLHSMRKREFLETALTHGLMLTDHEVRFNPANHFTEWQLLLDDVMPVLKTKLVAMGRPWDTLSEDRRKILMAGIGSVSGEIPMLCFTEVPEGRSLTTHHFSFGGYGVVVHRQWIESNGGDRVLYIGDNSHVSRSLFRLLATLQISNLQVAGPEGLVLFNTDCYRPVLELLTHMEVRDNLPEFEWRIAGRHGFFGGGRDTGKRLPLPLEQVEAVLVQNPADVPVFEELVRTIGASQSPSTLPVVLCQPETLSAA